MLSRDDFLIELTVGSPFFVSLQGELGLPGPPGLDGEKVRGAWLERDLAGAELKGVYLCVCESCCCEK